MGVAPGQVFATARGNLAALASAGADRATVDGPAVLRFLDDGNAYYTSRILLDGWLAGLADEVGGQPVAFVPDNNSLLVTADHPDALPKLFELVEEEYAQAPRGLSPQAYTVDGHGRVIPYQASGDHPAARAASRAAIVLAAAEYGAQGRWLARQDSGVQVAELAAVQRPDGSMFTYTVWGEGVDALLPHAQMIAFTTGVGDPFFVPWHVVEQLVGLVPLPDLHPDRYRVRGWPASAVIAELRERSAEP